MDGIRGEGEALCTRLRAASHLSEAQTLSPSLPQGVYRGVYGVRTAGTFSLVVEVKGEMVVKRQVTIGRPADAPTDGTEVDNHWNSPSNWGEEFSAAKSRAEETAREETRVLLLKQAEERAAAERDAELLAEWNGAVVPVLLGAKLTQPLIEILTAHHRILRDLFLKYCSLGPEATVAAVAASSQKVAPVAAAPSPSELGAVDAEVAGPPPEMLLRGWSLLTKRAGLVQRSDPVIGSRNGGSRGMINALFQAQLVPGEQGVPLAGFLLLLVRLSVRIAHTVQSSAIGGHPVGGDGERPTDGSQPVGDDVVQPSQSSGARGDASGDTVKDGGGDGGYSERVSASEGDGVPLGVSTKAAPGPSLFAGLEAAHIKAAMMLLLKEHVLQCPSRLTYTAGANEMVLPPPWSSVDTVWLTLMKARATLQSIFVTLASPPGAIHAMPAASPVAETGPAPTAPALAPASAPAPAPAADGAGADATQLAIDPPVVNQPETLKKVPAVDMSTVLTISRAVGAGLVQLPNLINNVEVTLEDATEMFIETQGELVEDERPTDYEYEVDFEEWLTWIWCDLPRGCPCRSR